MFATGRCPSLRRRSFLYASAVKPKSHARDNRQGEGPTPGLCITQRERICLDSLFCARGFRVAGTQRDRGPTGVTAMLGEFRRGHVIQAAAEAFLIVFVAPGFYHILSVSAVEKDVHVQAFVTKLVMETLNVRVFPGASRCDVDGLGAALGKSVLSLISDQLPPRKQESSRTLDPCLRGGDAGRVTQESCRPVGVRGNGVFQRPPAQAGIQQDSGPLLAQG